MSERFPGIEQRARRLLAIGLLVILAIGLRGAISGWRVHTMTTASMGTTAPVGSLVFTTPTLADHVHVGDVLAFHPPGRPNTTFVHRIIGISQTADGLVLRSKGDINGSPDPWIVTPTNVVGRVALTVPAAGYFLQMVPALLLGVFLILLLSRGVRRGRRTPIRVLAGSLLLCALVFYYQPLTRVELIAQTVSGNAGHAAVVPTGILPLRISVLNGTHADVVPGQVGTLKVEHLDPGGAFSVHAHAHLSGWWWLLAITWVVPLLFALRSKGELKLA